LTKSRGDKALTAALQAQYSGQYDEAPELLRESSEAEAQAGYHTSEAELEREMQPKVAFYF